MRFLLAGQIGAEITGADAGTPLSDEAIAKIRQALLDHKVVMGGRPPGIGEIIDIPLGRPRHALDTDTEAFLAVKRRIRAALRTPACAACSSWPTRAGAAEGYGRPRYAGFVAGSARWSARDTGTGFWKRSRTGQCSSTAVASSA